MVERFQSRAPLRTSIPEGVGLRAQHQAVSFNTDSIRACTAACVKPDCTPLAEICHRVQHFSITGALAGCRSCKTVLTMQSLSRLRSKMTQLLLRATTPA